MVLGDNLTTGIMIAYDFLRLDNSRLYQKQAIFRLNLDNVLIFSLSKTAPLNTQEIQRFNDFLKSFQTCS
nr:hypothetical protein [Pantoea allii]